MRKEGTAQPWQHWHVRGGARGKDVSHLQIALVGVNEYCLDTSLLSKHHSLTVEEMVIFPMPTKMGMEPSSPR